MVQHMREATTKRIELPGKDGHFDAEPQAKQGGRKDGVSRVVFRSERRSRRASC